MGPSVKVDDEQDEPNEVNNVPQWRTQQHESWGERLIIPEWEEEGNHNKATTDYRRSNGWLGTDLIHSQNSPVRVIEYYAKYINNSNNNNSYIGTTLTGIVEFTPLAESHKGYCHGGSVCSVFDDVIGWCGFLASGKCIPWSGFTAQINTALKKPIKVNSVLLVQARIVRRERRKVSIEAVLMDPSVVDGEGGNGGGAVHATGEGLVVLNREMVSDQLPSTNGHERLKS